MEVDNIIEDEWDLINKLNTMGTRDREDLLTQFQSIVGTQMSPGCCTFYLEMGNWNLQTALCAYYDLSAANERLPLIELINESIHLQERSVAPNQPFEKLWILKNTGTEPWPSNLKVKFVQGYNFSHGSEISLPCIGPDETTEIRIAMTAPNEEGLFQSQWKPITISGTYCGSALFISVNVDSSSISNLTQQFDTTMSQFQPIATQLENGFTVNVGTQLSTQPISTPSRVRFAGATPFCSPTGYGMFGSGNTNTMQPAPNLPTIVESLSQQQHQQQREQRQQLELQQTTNNINIENLEIESTLSLANEPSIEQNEMQYRYS